MLSGQERRESQRAEVCPHLQHGTEEDVGCGAQQVEQHHEDDDHERLGQRQRVLQRRAVHEILVVKDRAGGIGGRGAHVSCIWRRLLLLRSHTDGQQLKQQQRSKHQQSSWPGHALHGCQAPLREREAHAHLSPSPWVTHCGPTGHALKIPRHGTSLTLFEAC